MTPPPPINPPKAETVLPELSIPDLTRLELPSAILEKVQKLYAEKNAILKENLKLVEDLKPKTLTLQLREESVETIRKDLVFNEGLLKEAKAKGENTLRIEGAIIVLQKQLARAKDDLATAVSEEKDIQTKIDANLAKIASIKTQISDLLEPYLSK